MYDDILNGEADEVLTPEMAHEQALRDSTARRFQLLRDTFLDKNSRVSEGESQKKGGLKKKKVGLKSSSSSFRPSVGFNDASEGGEEATKTALATPVSHQSPPQVQILEAPGELGPDGNFSGALPRIVRSPSFEENVENLTISQDNVTMETEGKTVPQKEEERNAGEDLQAIEAEGLRVAEEIEEEEERQKQETEKGPGVGGGSVGGHELEDSKSAAAVGRSYDSTSLLPGALPAGSREGGGTEGHHGGTSRHGREEGEANQTKEECGVTDDDAQWRVARMSRASRESGLLLAEQYAKTRAVAEAVLANDAAGAEEFGGGYGNFRTVVDHATVREQRRHQRMLRRLRAAFRIAAKQPAVAAEVERLTAAAAEINAKTLNSHFAAVPLGTVAAPTDTMGSALAAPAKEGEIAEDERKVKAESAEGEKGSESKEVVSTVVSCATFDERVLLNHVGLRIAVEVLGLTLSEADALQILSFVDFDGDGLITFDEFVVGVQSEVPDEEAIMDFLLQKRLGKVFEKADEARKAEVARLDALLKYHGVEPRAGKVDQAKDADESEEAEKRRSNSGELGDSGTTADEDDGLQGDGSSSSSSSSSTAEIEAFTEAEAEEAKQKAFDSEYARVVAEEEKEREQVAASEKARGEGNNSGSISSDVISDLNNSDFLRAVTRVSTELLSLSQSFYGDVSDGGNGGINKNESPADPKQAEAKGPPVFSF